MPAPTDYTADYNASTGITLGTGSNVSALADSSGNGFHLTQAVEANQPTEVSIDGIDAIFFDQNNGFNPAGKCLTNFTWGDLLGTTANLTVAARIRVPVNPYTDETANPEQTNGIICLQNGGGGPLSMRRHTTDGNQIGFSMFNTSFASQIHMAPMPALDTWFDVVVRKNGATISVFIDGIKTDGTFTGTYSTPDASSVMNLARNSDASTAWGEFYLTRLRTYDYALTDSEAQDISDDWDGGGVEPPAELYWPTSFFAAGVG